MFDHGAPPGLLQPGWSLRGHYTPREAKGWGQTATLSLHFIAEVYIQPI